MAIIAVLGIALVVLSDEAEAVTSISLSIQGSDTQTVNPGNSATFTINVTNTLTTTTLTVNLTYSTPPTGWTAQLSQTQISVAALATKSVTLTVGVPSTAGADSVGKQIIVTADPDFGDTEQITTTTKVAQTYGIQTSTTTASKTTVGGSTVTFSLRINNTGNGQDTVSVTHSGQPSTWTVSHVSTITITAGGSKTVTITVVPPSNAAAGTYQTTVKATSSDGTTNDQTSFIIIIQKVYGLTLSSSDVSKYVTPNVAAYYNMSVTNTGNTGDNAIIGVTPPSGWTVLPTSNPVALTPNQTKTFQILVTAPTSVLAGTQVQIPITATSNGNSSILRTLTINAVVNQVYDPRVTPQTNSKVVAPGGSVTFKIDVTNSGNGNDTMDLSLSGVPSGQGWVYNFNPVSVSLTPGQSKTVNLTFTIGSSAAYGDNMVTVTGTSHGTTNKGSTTVVVSVSQFYNLALVPVGASTKRVDPGGTVDFDLQVTNTGNGPDDLTFQAIGLDGSWVSYFTKTTVYNLPANSSETSTLTIELPSTTNSGTYRFDVKCTSGGNSSVYRAVKNITIIVNQLFDVSISPQNLYYSGLPGAGILVNLTVTNEGSGTDNFTLAAPGQYSSWVKFSSNLLALGPGASSTVTATVTPPAGTAAGDVTVTFKATSKGRTTVFDEASVTVTVKNRYAAGLTAVESVLNKKPTETATFSVQLKNTGNTADTFKVNFTSNPRNLASHSLSFPYVSLGMGATRSFTVTVTVPSAEPVGNLVFRLLATSQNDTNAKGTLTLTVVVSPVYSVDLYSYDATAEAEPTDSDVVELRIKNTGNGQDTFALKATGPYYRWVSFERSSVTLAASGEMLVNMTVTVPDLTTKGIYFINITATSTADSTATKVLQVKITVLHKEDLELSAADLVRRRSTDPGGTVTYTVKVENTGLSTHVVNMALSGEKANWAKLNKSLVIIPAGASANVRVTVTVPDETAPMSFDLDVTGTFDDNPSRTDIFTLITTVNRVMGVRVELNDTTLSAAPGDVRTLILNVNNTGNDVDTFDLSVDINSKWVTFTPKFVTLAAGMNGNVTVRIVPPRDPLTPEGVKYMNFTATSRGNTSVMASDLLELDVEQVYAITVKTVPARTAVEPGQSAVYDVTITNKGNGRDTFVITLEGTRKAWGRLSAGQVTLDAGQVTTVTLTVRIPSNQPVEDVAIVVNVTSSGADDVTVKANTVTTINPYFGVDLTISDASKPGFPSKFVVFKVKVKNTGNSRDTFNFEVTGDYASWVRPMNSIGIDPGKIATLEVNITPPIDIENGDYFFTINASSDTQGDAFDELELEVNINVFYRQTVDLSKDEVDTKPGALETVLVTVENTGNVNDTYDVRALGTYASWVSIDNETLEADEGDSVVATATIDVNATSSGQYVIRFKVTSRGGGNVTEVSFTIHINLRYGVSLFAVKPVVAGAPNITVDLEVRLVNVGNIEDTFNLAVAQVPGSLWEASTEVNRLTVPDGGEAWFNVTAVVPGGLSAGKYVIRVKATSTRAPAATSTIPLNLSIAFAVNATGPSGLTTMLPGARVTVKVTIQNDGLGRDGFNLYILDDYDDWATPAVTNVVLGPGASTVVDVEISPPVDTETGTYVVPLRAESVSDRSAFDIADIQVRVRQVYGVDLRADTLRIVGPADIWHEVDITVVNNGNGDDEITLFTIVDGGMPIEARFSSSLVKLGAGTEGTTVFKVKAERTITAGQYTIEVVARSRYSEADPASLVFTYEVPAVHALEVKTETGGTVLSILDTVVGADYQFTIEVTNKGNADDTLSIIVASEDPDLAGWFTFQQSEFTVKAGRSMMVMGTISVPISALADIYEFDLITKSLAADVNATLPGTIEVNPDREVTVTTALDQATINPTGTTGAVYSITVRNNGNIQETVTLEVTMPSRWQAAVVEPETVTVAAGDTSVVTVTVPTSAVPSNPNKVNSITVKARYGDKTSLPLGLMLTVLQPEVSVVSALPVKLSPENGDLVDVTIKVKNTGDVDAKGLTVILLVDEVEAGRLERQAVPANGEKDVTISWEVDSNPGDTVNIKVRIPEEDVLYTEATLITIKEEEGGFFAAFETMNVMLLLILGLIIGLVIGLLIAGGVRSSYKRQLSKARAKGMAEGLSLAEDEKLRTGDEEAEEAEGEEGVEEEAPAEGEEEEPASEAEEEEEVPPAIVQCPKCETINTVTTAQRPYEFRCEECNALLRLKE